MSFQPYVGLPSGATAAIQVHVCVSVCERERARERERVCVYIYIYVKRMSVLPSAQLLLQAYLCVRAMRVRVRVYVCKYNPICDRFTDI